MLCPGFLGITKNSFKFIKEVNLHIHEDNDPEADMLEDICTSNEIASQRL